MFSFVSKTREKGKRYLGIGSVKHIFFKFDTSLISFITDAFFMSSFLCIVLFPVFLFEVTRVPSNTPEALSFVYRSQKYMWFSSLSPFFFFFFFFFLL